MSKVQKPVKRTRRPYSRDGCQECKNRKLKCDETKPICWHCQRLNKDCHYKKNIRFSDSRSFTLNTVLSKTCTSSTTPAFTVTTSSPSSEHSASCGKPADHLEAPSPSTSNSDTSPPVPVDPSGPHIAPQEETIEEISRTPIVPGTVTPDLNGLSPLLNSINNITNELTPNEYNELASLTQLNEPLLTSPLKPSTDYDALTLYESSTLPAPSVAFPLAPALSLYNLTSQQSRYLETFYYRTSYHIMPFSMANSNPVRDSILSMAFDNSFLFSAVMAASSRTTYRISNDPNDDIASAQYLSQTLNSLSYNLSTGIDFSSLSFEAVLTTILILCTDHTSSHNLGWRAHLRGAKDLLDRGIEILKSQDGARTVTNYFNSRTMAFCKVWFAALEVVASITSPRGGTIAGGFASHEAFIDIGLSELQNAGMIMPNGFNLFLGYSTSCLSIFSELARLLKISRSPQGLTHNETRDIEKLISDIHAAKQISFPDSDFDLGDMTEFDEKDAEVPASEVPSLPDSGWFYISHKAHCEAAMLAVYTSLMNLPSYSPIVSSSLSTLMALLAHIPYKDFRGTMIHWPLLTAGLHATTSSREKFVLDRLDLLFQNGVWSAEFSKTRVRERYKDVQRFTKMTAEEYEEELDTVPF